MECRATIRVPHPELYAALLKELRSQDRSEIEIKRTDELVIDVKAKDTIAFRATMNSISKLLTVYEKIDDMRV